MPGLRRQLIARLLVLLLLISSATGNFLDNPRLLRKWQSARLLPEERDPTSRLDIRMPTMWVDRAAPNELSRRVRKWKAPWNPWIIGL